ncbi:restriction endonuclease subunit S [Limosilactobacillus reuteri]|uniref:restriction endonuclease subunit S n=1 Tax=Limosilactobacillus reuteri TaxID=1598 RepID=UPI003CFBEF94
MKKLEQRVPNLRFKGFTDDWEQRKLYEVADYRNGKAHEQHIYIHGNYIVVNSKFVSTSGKAKKYSDKLIEPLMKNEIAFVLSDVPNGKALARTFLVKRSQKYTLNQRVAGITPHPNMNSYFLFILMNRNPYFLKFDDGVGQTNLSKKDVEQFNENYPTKREQQKIGEIFVKLDSLLTLQQRKLDLLKQLKKGLLQKMFAAEKNSKQPVLRFKGFHDDWEQRKFSEILAKSDGLRRGPFGSALKKEFFISSSEYTVYEQNNAIYNTWKTRYFITPEKFQELHKFQLVPGDFILSGAGTIGRIAQVPANIIKGVFNQALIRIRINPEWMDKNFFLIWMQSENMQRKLTQANPGSAMTNLVPMSEIKKWEIIIPSKAEQNKIGEFIQKLNSLINLQQRKQNHLKLLKKSLLQQMFM